MHRKPLRQKWMEAGLECGKAAGKKVDYGTIPQMRYALDEPQQVVSVDGIGAFRASQQFLQTPSLQRIGPCHSKSRCKAIELKQERTCRPRVHLLAEIGRAHV